MEAQKDFGKALAEFDVPRDLASRSGLSSDSLRDDPHGL